MSANLNTDTLRTSEKPNGEYLTPAEFIALTEAAADEIDWLRNRIRLAIAASDPELSKRILRELVDGDE